MELTRRDALAALLVGSASAGTALSMSEADDDPATGKGSDLTEGDVEILTAVAAVVYPSELTTFRDFIDEYVRGLHADQRAKIAVTARALDERTRRMHGSTMQSLSLPERDSVLRTMGVGRVGSDPDGSLPERVRYYIVNQLLYGLYTSPKGSRLLGVENPVGHPGGYESYQKPPDGIEPQTDE
ncbi:gluconate 2-dehydrogenase subunit 3 family protein [Haloarcula sp. S1AR25-5A]|uniref:Gluconate 2-dehydrogenase subunit 3 family protein n=1 Tax=Haloarcula terrestris TaxID=2950533 RepID=A0AAE4F101_9EURY|nr:gluconate 2-dehydrogenase subunit 3 family protein [Haloarcula terrestris]MDS0223109.1 gluconate 2-dehydrogenase subunit 3 family protein [Haloarcula terrestris]